MTSLLPKVCSFPNQTGWWGDGADPETTGSGQILPFLHEVEHLYFGALFCFVLLFLRSGKCLQMRRF